MLSAGREIPIVTDAGMADQGAQRFFIVRVRDQPLPLVHADTRAIPHRDAGTFLPPVLQRPEPGMHQPRDFRGVQATSLPAQTRAPLTLVMLPQMA